MKCSVLYVCLLLFFTCFSWAQRIPAIPQDAPTSLLPGHRSPELQSARDLGPVNPSTVVRYVSLIFRRTAAQQSDLDQLLSAQRDPTSPAFMRWLTPAQFADRFGMDAASLDNVRDWLVARGFSIDAEAASRTWIAFSGTAAQIDRAFHTALHSYQAGAAAHFAPSRDPELPQSLAAEILAIRGLDDFYGVRVGGPSRPGSPALSSATSGNSLTPDDLAAIYDVTPLYAAGIDGTGQTIAIVGTSAISLSDIAAYRSKFGFSTQDPQLIAVSDPGIPGNITAGQSEASLDLEVTAAIARGASQIYVYSTNFEDAAAYAIDHALAPVLSMSYLNCEKNFTSSQTASRLALGQEAASKGITWVVASGDSGPAACDHQDVIGAVAQNGVWVNGWAALPDVTAVGGTNFNESGLPPNQNNPPTAAYWNGANGQNFGSAGMYIPEIVWDDSTISGSLLASGGGSSKLFPKPSWQAGANVPNDGARDIPDVALAASGFHDGYFDCNAGACTGGHGGTSAATPAFAGMMALVNQYVTKFGGRSAAGLGNVNPMLYRIANSGPANPVAPAFHDITTGSNTVPCLQGTPDCTSGSFGYSAAANYDLATGLGSIDTAQLAAAWLNAIDAQRKATTTSVNTAAATDPRTFTVTVGGPDSSSPAPSGSVVLTAGSVPLGKVSLTPGDGNTSTATFTIYNAQLPQGSSVIVAMYTGSTTYLPSVSSSVPNGSPGAVTVQVGSNAPRPAVQVSITPDPIEESPTAYGSAWYFTLTIREVNGVNAPLSGFKVNGIDESISIPAWFGGATLPAFGSVSVPLKLALPNPPGPNLPATLSVQSGFGSAESSAGSPAPITIPAFTPPDAISIEIDLPFATSTAAYTAASFTAPLLARPNPAKLQLIAVPSAVLRNPSGAANCQWSQQLMLRNLTATGVSLKDFNAGGTNMNQSIATLWGATRIEANSELTAAMCWSGLTAPVLITYEIDGTDDNGNTASAALTSAFLNQPSSPNTLTVTSTNPAVTSPFSLNTAARNLTFKVGASSPSQAWSVTVSTSGQSPDWLSVFPLSGQGPGGVYVTPASGLTSGTYTATLLFHSADAEPQVVAIPITYLIQ